MSPGEWVNRTKAGVTQARPDPDRNIPVKCFCLCSCSCSCFRLFGAIPFFFGTGKRVCETSLSLYPAVCVASGMHVFPPSVLILEMSGEGKERGFICFIH